MNNETAQLLEHHFDTAFAAPDGIKKLRELILTLAMQGRLVEQDLSDQPASELLKEIEAEKQRLLKEGKIKKSKPLPPIKLGGVPYQLPKGWEWVRLDAITSKITDGDHKTPPRISEGYRLLSAKNVRNGFLDFDNCDFISEQHYLKSRERCLPETGDLLIVSVGGTIGRTSLVPQDSNFALVRSAALIKPLLVNSKYLKYAMDSELLQASIHSRKRGGAQPCLYLSEIQLFLFSLPPLPEQHRIVVRIDQLMARCDELEKLRAEREEKRLAVHNAAIRQLLDAPDGSAWDFIQQHFGELYTVKENVAELRKAILQLAVMGRLVPHDPNDQPASELLKEIEAEKQRLVKAGKIKKPKPLPPIKPEEVPYEVPKGWEWVRVWDVAQLITSGSRDWAKYYSDSGAIFVTMSNLSRGSYQLRTDTIRYVTPPSNSEGSRTKLEENDLLISITGDVGNLGLIPAKFGEAYINQHTCLLRFMTSCRNRYFPELMRSPLAKEQFDAPQRGIKNSFRLGDVGEMVIPLPPLPQQHRIVAKIDQLMALCDTLEQQNDAATTKQAELLGAVMARCQP